MAARPDGNRYLGDFMVAGIRYRRSFKSEELAVEWETRSRANLAAGKAVERRPYNSTGRTPVRAAASPYTAYGLFEYVSDAHWKGNKAADTQIRNALHFVTFVGRHTPLDDAFAPDTLGRYLKRLRTSGLAGSTINRHLAAVSKMAKVAVKARWIEAMPFVPWQKEPAGRTLVLSRNDVDAIIATARAWKCTREADMLQFLVDTGCRLGEAGQVRWNDFTDGFRSVTFARDTTKKASDRTLPLFPTSIDAMARRKAAAGHLPGPFQDAGQSRLRRVWNLIKAHLKLSNEATIHTLRHTRCTWFAREGWDFWRIQKWMGHSAIVTTKRYTNLVSNDLDAMVAGALQAVAHSGTPQPPTETTPVPSQLDRIGSARPEPEVTHAPARPLPPPPTDLEQRVAALQACFGAMSKEQLVGLCVSLTLKEEGLIGRGCS